MKTLSDAVLCGLKPKVFYRSMDIAMELHIDPQKAASSLRELSRGGVIDKVKEKGRVVYITKQEHLF